MKVCGCPLLMSMFCPAPAAHVNCPAAADRLETSRRLHIMLTVDMMG
jgi:hypothetical protein